MKEHLISGVEPDSIASEYGFEPGDVLLSINDAEIEDTFDYQYLISDEYLVLKVRTKQGEEVEVEIEKEQEEDLGLIFENSFMDQYRSCKNKCIFCFIDQMPPGLRETLYFKDDDTRLSFLLGNYVTLTNLSEADINKIIKYRMEPINVSFQTMNPELRCKMLNNRFAGEALKKADLLYEAGIEMNGQIVLCKGVNDKEELEYSLEKLYRYVPTLQSVSVVPVGLSKYREGLYHLEPFEREDALEVIDCIGKWQQKAYEEKGIHFVHASDEWYFLAGLSFPEEESYDGYLQLENGVGMVRNFVNEFSELYREKFKIEPVFSEMIHKNDDLTAVQDIDYSGRKQISVITGRLFGPVLKECTKNLERVLPELKINVYEIRNDFFGEMITVAGLVTGRDIIAQLKEKEIGEALILPDTMIRCYGDVFLDDITVSEVETTLHCKADIVKSNGADLIRKVLEFI
ncbi:MAG: DUF512 domain-containing protein [Lachnospiraceae bacterium]|nr:DUF512 domain-containing protein [Lachnospiraceae bacterium]